MRTLDKLVSPPCGYKKKASSQTDLFTDIFNQTSSDKRSLCETLNSLIRV